MKYCGLSDIGLIRETNQDSFYCSYNEKQEFLAIVCDGIGGGKAGDIASKIACEVFVEMFEKKKIFSSDKKNKEWIEEVIRKANNDVYESSLTSRTRHGMGTTLVGVLITKKATYVFHLGDSRVYGIYEKELICFTEDHNLAADLIKSGELSEKDALLHPRGKALTNALGIWSQYKVDINKIRTGYKYLLVCSDGLHGYINEKVIQSELIEANNVEEKAKRYIELSKQSGGFDNVTVIVIEVGGK